MIKRSEIYKCKDCNATIEVLNDYDCELSCCGNEMEKLTAKTADEGKEKHVPVIEKVDGGIKVKFGSVPHPMEEKHHIEWIEVMTDGKVYRQFLKPGTAPEAIFNVDGESSMTVREHCNIHGLWKTG